MRGRVTALLVTAAFLTVVSEASAQPRRYYEQAYFGAPHNWALRNEYPAADRLFNAFDYGHAVLYERLYTRPEVSPALLERDEFAFITGRLLVRPPRVPLDERAIAPAYARLAPELVAVFDWAHMLHRQLYDVWADEDIAPARKDAYVAELLQYYRSRPALALSSAPKRMELMEAQPYSLVFRQRHEKFNGLIWSYHWLQMALYDALLVGRNRAERRANVAATVAHFRRMLQDPPSRLPSVMPMSAAVAPAFTAAYPEAAAVFDNLHALHDVVADILASPRVPRAGKRAEILHAIDQYRDAHAFAITQAEWREMSLAMGVERMGGLAPVSGRDTTDGPRPGHPHEGHGTPPRSRRALHGRTADRTYETVSSTTLPRYSRSGGGSA